MVLLYGAYERGNNTEALTSLGEQAEVLGRVVREICSERITRWNVPLLQDRRTEACRLGAR